jgi:hypothetical protein
MDVEYKKEYYQYKLHETHFEIPRFALDDSFVHLKLHPAQELMTNVLSPHTPFNRAIIKWDPGLGKTIFASSLAMRFLNINPDSNIFIIGFTEENFKTELTRFPEFGFVSYDELELKKKYERLGDVNALHNLNIKIRRRLTSGVDNGRFKFYGYKTFLNRIFDLSDFKGNINESSEEEIINALKNGGIKWNKTLLESFNSSLVICDEFHAIFNSVEKNNWGVAIQAVFDYHKNNIKVALLSATPLNNHQTEVIDCANFILLPHEKIKKDDVFDSDDKLLPHGLDVLKRVFKNKVSFVQDINPLYYPTENYEGVCIPTISYLKFIRCPMTDYHLKTYKSVDSTTLSIDEQYLSDIALPNPNGDLGLFKTNFIKRNLSNVDNKFYNKHGFKYSNGRIIGHGFQKENIKQWSNKMFKLLELVNERLTPDSGKIFIYHNIVHMSGVFFIEELLKNNGYIQYGDNVNDNTVCVICGIPKKAHKKGKINKNNESKNNESKNNESKNNESKNNESKNNESKNNESKKIKITFGDQKSKIKSKIKSKDHMFTPATFISAHADMDKSQIHKLLRIYNNQNNLNGEIVKIVIGSRVLKEGYNILSTETHIVVGRPDNIPTLIQINGRVKRKNSHKDLPPERRHIKRYILVSSYPGFKKLTYEERKWKEKINSYKIIQKIERVFHENDIHGNILRYMVENGLDKENKSLGALYFNPNNKIKKELKLNDLNLDTFEIFNSDNEIYNIIYIIKKLFIEYSQVFDENELYKNVLNPPFPMNFNTTLIQKEYFLLALNFLLTTDDIYNTPVVENDYSLYKILYNSFDSNIMMLNGNIGNIYKFKNYYILLPNGEINPEVLYRKYRQRINKDVNIYKYVKHDMKDNYELDKINLIEKYINLDIEDLSSFVNNVSVKFNIKFLEEIIEYVFNSWTNTSTLKSEYHDFYFKILYYYDILGLVIWGDELDMEQLETYKKYIIPVDPKKKIKMSSMSNVESSKSSYHKALKLSAKLSKMSSNTKGKKHKKLEEISKMDISGDVMTAKLSKNDYKISGKTIKIAADLLPIGHFIDIKTKLWHPEKKWITVPAFNKYNIKFIENDKLIGYHDRPTNSLKIKFKIRKPFNMTELQERDNRLIEKGSVCVYHTKNELAKFAKLLDVKTTPGDKAKTICDKIEMELQVREFNERKNKTKIKWFYNFWELQPDIKQQTMSSHSSSVFNSIS